MLPALICCRLSEIIYFAAQVPGRTRTIPQVERKKCNDIYNSEAHKTSVVKIAVIMGNIRGDMKLLFIQISDGTNPKARAI